MTNEDLNGRINKMAAWAASVDEKLKALTAVHSNHYSQAIDPVVEELNQHWQTYDNIPEKIKDKKLELIEVEMVLSQCKDEIAEIVDNTALTVAMEIGENGKMKFSNESMRKAAAAKQLRQHSKYNELTEQRRGIDRLILQAKAEIEYLENMMTEFSRRNRALTVRIEYATALINKGA